MIKNIFYDLDGTLLPMDMNKFMEAYFYHMVMKFAPLGYDKDELPKQVWAGTKVMVMNDGTRTNEEAFWDFFTKAMNVSESDKELFTEYYEVEFDKVQSSCGFNEKVPKLIQEVKNMGFNQVLATNPLFPEIATRKRISWAGLDTSDFLIYTTYENSHYCKPNTKYYQELLDKLDMKAEETLMIGNDVEEDMVAAELGMKVFLVTDCILNPKGKDISIYPNGNFDDVLEYIKRLFSENKM